MNTELFMSKMCSSGLLNEDEVVQWKERLEREGSSPQLLREVIGLIENRTGLLADTLSLTEDSSLYKELLMDGYQQLQEVGKQYRSGEARLARQMHEDSIATDRETAARSIEQARSQLAE